MFSATKASTSGKRVLLAAVQFDRFRKFFKLEKGFQLLHFRELFRHIAKVQKSPQQGGEQQGWVSKLA